MQITQQYGEREQVLRDASVLMKQIQQDYPEIGFRHNEEAIFLAALVMAYSKKHPGQQVQ